MKTAKEKLKIINNDIKKAKVEISALLSKLVDDTNTLEEVQEEIVKSLQLIKGLELKAFNINENISSLRQEEIDLVEEIKDELKYRKDSAELQVSEFIKELNLRIQRVDDSLTIKGEQEEKKQIVLDGLTKYIKSLHVEKEVLEVDVIKEIEKFDNIKAKTKTEKDKLESYMSSILEGKKEDEELQEKISKGYEELQRIYDTNNNKQTELAEKEELLTVRERKVLIAEGRINNKLINKQ